MAPEQLEERRVMAFDFVSAYAAADAPFYVAGQVSRPTLVEAPQQVTLRFSPGVKIDAATLGGISVVASGGDGTFGNGNDAAIVPGSVTVDDLPNQNQVVIRFADTLPDDTYQITIGGGDSGLKTVTGDTMAASRSFDVRLDLGAFVVAVVPQPVSRTGGVLSQNRSSIVVHFNRNDPLAKTSAETAALYRLFEVNAAGDDVPAVVAGASNWKVPSGVVYDAAAGTATLSFAAGDIADDKLYRLQIGGGSAVVGAAAVVAEGSDENSSFTTARDMGSLTAAGAMVTGSIQPRPALPNPAGSLLLPLADGAVDSPGHRDIPSDSGGHGNSQVGVGADAVANVIQYNFRSNYGSFNGVPQQNAITEAQKQRAREVFELFGRTTGMRFVETASSGMTIATGDIRVAAPNYPPQAVAGIAGGSGVIMNSSLDWGQSEYGGGWFMVALHEIGHALGLEHSYDLPTVMGKGLPGEAVFPSDYDMEQLAQYYPANSNDVDLYKFKLDAAGRLNAETVIARPGQPLYASSKLDSVITLYREEVVGGRTVRTLVARNDDSFGRDSFLGLDLAAGTYYLAVSSTGNDAFNPEVSDSGAGGRTDGAYQLKLGFQPAAVAANTIVDGSGTPLDGDRDGEAGGIFSFWFTTASAANTIFVDKAAAAGGTGSPGSLTNPHTTIAAALAAVTPATRIVRIVGNDQNRPYLVGTTLAGQPLPDGATFDVPKGVTAMIDAGAIIKLRAANIDVGSASPLVSRSGAALQVLGTPDRNVIVTSYHDDAVGGDSDGVGPAVNGGQWGGIVLRADSDAASKRAFVNSIAQATITYGGGQVLVDSELDSFAPITLESARPTVIYNTIRSSSGAGIAANPDSFEESSGRVGPELRGNRLLANSINGLFIKIRTALGGEPERLDVPARLKSTDIVYVLQDNLLIGGGAGGYVSAGGVESARPSGRLAIDPGVVVKLQGARIELERGTAQLIAEGTAGQRVIFTSLGDNRFGAGGTFDTNGNLPDVRMAGDWGGIVVNAGAKASIDYAYVAFGGGQTPIEGSFNNFNVFEVHQGDLRLAHSRVENNAAGTATGTRNGRGSNVAATVFARGAQPVVLGNDFRDNRGAIVSINANSLTDAEIGDPGRSTGPADRDARYDANRGPLVRDNRISYTIDAAAGRPAGGAIGGMEVRGEEIDVESVWDDVDIVHVLRSEIIVQNLHTYTGVRLLSDTNASLVVKLLGANAGFTASGYGLDIDDRIGGTVQVVGQPGYPVVLTSLADDTVGASLDPLGLTVKDTNTDGTASAPAAGDWRSLQFLPMSNDRNVSIVQEAEKTVTQGIDVNATPGTAQGLGVLAPNFATGSNTFDSAQEKSGDDLRRLGFEVHGTVAVDDPTDVDVYSFTGYAGSEVWIDIDKTSPALDTMVELLDAAGNVRARSVDSQLEGGIGRESVDGVPTADPLVYTFPLAATGVRAGSLLGWGFASGQSFTVDAAGTFTFADVGGHVDSRAVAGSLDAANGIVTLTYNAVPADPPSVYFQYTHEATPFAAGTRGVALPLARDSAKAGDHYSTNPRDAGMRVVLPGDGKPAGTAVQYFVRVRSQPRHEPAATGGSNGGVTATTKTAYEAALADAAKVKSGATSGSYELRVRLRQLDEKPGSTVRYADIRYPTIGIDVKGLPRNSLLTSEIGENPTDTTSDSTTNPLAAAQYVGNLLESDRNTIGIAGDITNSGDVDWYTFALNYEQIQSIGGVNGGQKTWSTVFDLDYGDGVRGDLTVSVFDAQGRLLYVGRDSNVQSDQPGAGQGADTDDLSRGSLGTRDAFIGPVQMPAGNPTGFSDSESGLPAVPPDPTKQLRFYVAVSSNGRLPTALNATFNSSALNSLIRLEPVNSTTRVVEDHIGSVGYTSFGADVAPATKAPLFDVTRLSTHITPFSLSDVTLFVSTAGSLRTVDPMRGGVETTIQTYGTNTADDLFMRADGRLYSYRGNPGAANTAGSLVAVDAGNGGLTVVGNDGIADAPASTVQTDTTLVGIGAGFDPTVTFNLSKTGVALAGVNGQITYSGFVGATPANGAWRFSSDNAGNLSFFMINLPDASFPRPIAGFVNGGANQISVTWSADVNAGSARVTTVTYNFTGSPGAITTDSVDAMGWNWTLDSNPGALFYSVREGSRSRLYRADPSNGSAAPVTGQPWGYRGLIQDTSTSLGRVTGMAFVSGTLYGVDTNGYFFTINTGNGQATLIDLDPSTPLVADPLRVGGVVLDLAAGTTLNVTTVTLSSTAALRAGMLVSGPGIQAGTTIAQVVNGTSVQLSSAATATAAAATLQFRQLGNPVSFAGLTLGPQNLYGGSLRNVLFAIDNSGTLRAFSTQFATRGELQKVFDSDGDGVADATSIDTGVGFATGLAFSPLDVNLWHPTTRRGGDAGHGVNASLDNTREAVAGGASMYFGFEQYVSSNAPYEDSDWGATSGQYGVQNFQWQRTLSSNAAIPNTYNLPGGAYGSLSTNSFSLAGRTFADKPVLYFNYFLQSDPNASSPYDNNTMRDSARVFISADGGQTWTVVATNNPTQSATDTNKGELPATISASADASFLSNQTVQPLFRTASWRQARVDLGRWAGQSDLRLRIDFSTAGEMDDTQFRAATTQVAADVTASTTVRLASVAGIIPDMTVVAAGVDPAVKVLSVDADAGTVELSDAVTFLTGDTIGFSGQAAGLMLNGIQGYAGTTGSFGSSERGQRNDYEGFYVDDFIVGFAERGEMVTGAVAGQTGYFATPAAAPSLFVPAPNLQGKYQLEIRRGTEYGALVSKTKSDVAIFQTFDTNADLAGGFFRGDSNQTREQGQFLIESNIVTAAKTYGISLDAGRDGSTNAAVPGSVQNRTVLNTSRLVPGVVVSNNVIAASGTGGILFSGDPNTGNVPLAAVPFGRLVNNTISGGVVLDLTAATAGGSTTVTLASTVSLRAGMLVSGPGIQAGTTVAQVLDATRVRLSVAATATAAAATLQFRDTGTAGVGIRVTDNAGPTLLNNLFANLTTGVTVDVSSSPNTVVGTSAYWNTATAVSGVTQSQQVLLTADPFVSAVTGNYYLRSGSLAIDSGLNSLADRPVSTAVKSPLGIPDSPIIVPDRDLYGQLRADDPDQASQPGLGSNVFKDRGAIDRVDFTQPSAALVRPLDQGADDRDTANVNSVVLRSGARGQTSFELQLNDVGVGIDKATVTAAAFSLSRNGTPLVLGTDYVFRYLETSNRVVFEAASVFPLGTYVITATSVPSTGTAPGQLTDLANNTLLPNKTDGSTSFSIVLAEVPDAPTAVVGKTRDGAVGLTWTTGAENGAVITDHEIEYSATDTFPGTAVLTGSAAGSFTVPGLANGTGYSFRIRSVNAVGNGAWSAVVGPVMPLPRPAFGLVTDSGDSAIDGISQVGDVAVSGLQDAPGVVWQYSVDGGAGWQAGTGTGFTLAAGTYAAGGVRVRQLFPAGNTDTSDVEANAQPITIDVVQPTVQITSSRSSLRTGDTATISFVLSESSTTFGSDDISVVDGFLTNFTGSGAFYTATFTPVAAATASGMITVAAGTFRDVAGNPNLAGVLATPITIDNLAPTISIMASLANLKAGATTVLTFTLSESSLDFGENDVAVTGGLLSGFTGSGAIYQATFTPTAGYTGPGTVTVAAATFTDLAGNPNLAGGLTPALAIDTLPPTIAIASAATKLRIGQTSLVTFTLSEAANDFGEADVVVAGGTLSGFTGSGKDYTATFVPAAGFVGQGTITVAAGRFSDGFGNPNLAGALASPITIDTVAPSVTITSDQTTLGKGQVATISFTLSEPATNFGVADVAVTGGTLSGFVGSGTGYSAIFTPTADSTGQGLVSVAAGTFTDAAGNDNLGGSLPPIAIDTLSPTVLITSSRTALKIGETAVLTFSLSEPAADFAAGDVAVTGGTLSGFAGSGASYTATFTPTPGFSGSGAVSIAAGAFTDAFRNPSSDATLTPPLAIDTVAPGLSITASTAALKVGETATITFALTESSVTFGPEDVAVVGGVLSGFVGSGVSYSATFIPTPGFTGVGRVSAADGVFTDLAGNPNVGATLAVPIVIDTLPPTIAIATDRTTLRAGETAVVTFTLSESSTTFGADDVVVTGGTLSGFQGSATRYSARFVPTPGFPGTGSVSVRPLSFTDVSGNFPQGPMPAVSYAIDTLPPAAPVLSIDADIADGATLPEASRPAGVATVSGETGAAIVVAFVGPAGSVSKSLAGTGSGQRVVLTAEEIGRLGNGVVTVTATQMDAFGNGQIDAAATGAFLLDTVVPVAPALALGAGIAGGATLAEATAGGGVVTVVGEPGASVTVVFAGAAASVSKTVVGTGGALPVVLMAEDVARLGNGPVTVSCTQRDGVGNVSPIGTIGFSIDTVAPTLVSFTALVGNGTYRTGATIPLVATFSEAVPAGTAIVVRLNSGANVPVTLRAAAAGTELRGAYIVANGHVVQKLNVSSYAAVGTVTDLAGNAQVGTPLPGGTGQIAARQSVAIDAVIKVVALGGFSIDATRIPNLARTVVSVPVGFTTPVTGLTVSSFRLLLNGRSVSLRGAQLLGTGSNYTLRLPTRLASAQGIYTLQIVPNGIRAADNAAPMTQTAQIFWGNGRSVVPPPTPRALAFSNG